MSVHASTIVIEYRTAKSGATIAVVPAGKIAVGDVIETTTRMAMTSPSDGWEPTGKVNGFRESIYQRITRQSVVSLGREFTARGYYIDAEDNLSATGQHKAVRVPAAQAQYAYLEAMA